MIALTNGTQTRVRRLCWLIYCVALSAPGFAQVNWDTNERESIARAKQQDRLLVFHFTSDEDRGERQKGNVVDSQREQIRKLFRAPEVASIVNKYYVPVAADLKKNGKLKKELGVKVGANHVIITTPDLEILVHLRPNAKRDAEALAGTLKKQVREWGVRLYHRDIRPILENKEAAPGALSKALKSELLLDFKPPGADAAVISVVNRADLDPTVRSAAFQALAKLGTEDAVNKLFEQVEQYPVAEEAIRQLDRDSLGHLVKLLRDEPTAQSLRAYRIAAKLAGTMPKPDKFRQTASLEARRNEIARIKKMAEA